MKAKENKVLVSIYVVNHNYGKYIEQCLQSIYDQDFKGYEVIIIDSGSSDNSREIIEKFRNNKSTHIIYQENQNLSRTNNVAARIANGKYIIRVDADDYLHPRMIGELYKVIDNDPEIGLVFPDYYEVDVSGKIIFESKREIFQKHTS